MAVFGFNERYWNDRIFCSQDVIFPFILTSDALKSIVIEDMGYSDQETFPADIEASVVKDTNLVTLKVKSDEPQIAYDTLRSVLRNYPSISDVAIGEVTLKQMDESGFPTEPANSPGCRKYAAIGMLITLLICLTWLAFKSIARRTIRTERQRRSI